MASSTVNAIHVLGVAPLLMYTGYIGRQCAKDDEKCNKERLGQLSMVLAVVGLLVLIFHLYRYIEKVRVTAPAMPAGASNGGSAATGDTSGSAPTPTGDGPTTEQAHDDSLTNPY